MNKKKLVFDEQTETFTLENPDASYLYFPITNGFDLKGSITPTLNGDLKTDQNHFALLPVSGEDLQNSSYGRHFWMNIDGYGLYNAAGISAKQKVDNNDHVKVEAGLLYHATERTNKDAGIKVKTTTFSPFGEDNVELTKVTITNIKEDAISFVPTVAVPLFSRSADNLRDHRHVSALLNRSEIVENGIINKPTLSFDERGHNKNEITYSVYASGEKSDKIVSYNPKMQEFMGEGGSLDWPKALLNDSIGNYSVGDRLDGFEVIAAMQFEEKKLSANETYSYVFAITIDSATSKNENVLVDYCNVERFDALLDETSKYWNEKLSTFAIKTGDSDFDKWVKWVSLQPILRRIYGCSFLPHHDYGRGGRGWRDLWQDCLALLLMESDDVESMLFDNFAGVRIDGSNATIIGSQPGEFLADRNNIPRLWMDHGAWPWNTTKLFLDRNGDYDFLFKKQAYFKDANVHFSKQKDDQWSDEQGNKQRTKNGEIYEGTILEHILVQNLTQFYNVGEHNTIRLEGADWNDGLDMATNKGESVTFTTFYMMNLKQLASLLKDLQESGLNSIELYKELAQLIVDEVDYNDIDAKRALLNTYFESVTHKLSGDVETVSTESLIQSLEKKAAWMEQHIRKNEWINESDTSGWFNGYYDDHGKQLEGITDSVRMTLTGQVFPIMSGVATKDQVSKIITASKKYLYDQSVAGYRLNNDFNEVKLDMGRLFGFAFGHKENGAMFSHMAMMFANGLYKQGFISDANQIMQDIYSHCMDFDKGKIYPGIPEYIDIDGRGMYHYLTGSASWYILNVVDEMFGVKGHKGNLWLKPNLMKSQFDANNQASITTEFNGKRITITYVNEAKTDEYTVSRIDVNNDQVEFETFNSGATIDKALLKEHCNVTVTLA